MRPILAFFAILCGLGTTLTAQAQDRFLSTVTVSGTGTVDVEPDIATVRAGAITQGRTVREASDANTKIMTALFAALKELGIDGKDVQTSRLAVQPLMGRTSDGRNEPPRMTGYQVSNRIAVTIRDLGKLSDVLDRLIAAGANDVWNVEFGISDPSPDLDKAREQAMAEAHHSAELYARVAGGQLGRILSVGEDGAAMPSLMTAHAAAAPKAAIPIATGTEAVRVTVTVSYELVR